MNWKLEGEAGEDIGKDELRWESFRICYVQDGVYAIILRKAGYLPLVYIGSGTSVYRDVGTRIYKYKIRVLTPEKLKEAYDKGYKRTRIVVLAYYAIPEASQVPFIRPAILALEAAFSGIFWAIFNGILAPDQLAEIAAINREKQLAYGREYSRTLRKTKPEVVRARTRRANKLQAPKTEARQQEAIANGTYRYDVCGVNCRDAASLVIHNKTPRHARKVAEAAQAAEGKTPLYCTDCKLQFKYPSALKVHLKSKTHFRLSTRESLSRRQRTLDYRHHCKACNLKFPWASALRYHLRSEDHRRLSSQRN
ncbi:hypothetical protein C7999DRAFT_35964 [Corynascus novoguineensis]|uniref:C2H2-type domain-containing protein n=1 Tax=Corynascus novoguineensis TaxID=1126955 RepID=A0AAN7HKT8_9PEZI|nr:hypothetical protein C7999DRAFT_35964 [Corynascus novoguineensis]